jgi:ABC-type transport system substrate-binding protein
VRTSKIAVLAAGAALALVLSGCGASDSGSGESNGSGESGEPVTGGDITVVLSKDATRGLDPAFITNFTAAGDASRMQAIYGTLFVLDASTGEVSPGIGQSIEPDELGSV